MGVLRILPAAVWTAIILKLLLSESEGLPKFPWLDFPNADKLLHAGVFAVGSALILIALRAERMSGSLRPKVLAVAVWAIVLGSLTEAVQHCCVDTRSGEWADLMADLAGAALPVAGLWAVYFWKRRGHP